jgi:hypothetical protein
MRTSDPLISLWSASRGDMEPGLDVIRRPRGKSQLPRSLNDLPRLEIVSGTRDEALNAFYRRERCTHLLSPVCTVRLPQDLKI